MSRLTAPAIADAPAAAQPLFDAIRKGAGKVPNAYALIGALSPAALKLAMEGDAVLSRGTLSKVDLEAIRVAVSARTGCDYGVPVVDGGQLVGIVTDRDIAVRAIAGVVGPDMPVRRIMSRDVASCSPGDSVEDAKRQALVDFARHVTSTTGTVAAERVQAVLAAGWTTAQVVEALLTVSLIGFTNLVNRVNDTDVDFPIPV